MCIRDSLLRMPYITDNVPQSDDHLRAGHLVALPTETVYGLAADARQDLSLIHI